MCRKVWYAPSKYCVTVQGARFSPVTQRLSLSCDCGCTPGMKSVSSAVQHLPGEDHALYTVFRGYFEGDRRRGKQKKCSVTNVKMCTGCSREDILMRAQDRPQWLEFKSAVHHHYFRTTGIRIWEADHLSVVDFFNITCDLYMII